MAGQRRNKGKKRVCQSRQSDTPKGRKREAEEENEYNKERKSRGNKDRTDERPRVQRSRRRSESEFGTKFRHCEMTRVVFIASAAAAGYIDKSAGTGPSTRAIVPLFPGQPAPLSLLLIPSSSRVYSFVVPFPDITGVAARRRQRRAGREKLAAGGGTG